MKSFGKIFRAAALILAASISLTACSGSVSEPVASGSQGSQSAQSGQASQSTKQYKYGKINIPGKNGSLCAAPIYIAYDKGYLADEGFDATLVSADTEARKIGLNNGTIPVINGDFQYFPSIEQGVKIKVVGGLHFGCITIVVPGNSAIKSAEDLKGKKIAVDEIGGTPFEAASVWLENHGIVAQNNKDVTFVPYSDGNLEIEAAQKGEVDAAALWDPFGAQAVEDKGFKKIFDLSTDPIFADKYCCFLYASQKVLDEKPDEVAAILRAYQKAQDWIHSNPEEAVNIIADKKYANLTDKKQAVELVKSYQYPSLQQQDPDTVKNNVLYFAQQLSKIGYLQTKDPDKFTEQAYQYVKTS